MQRLRVLLLANNWVGWHIAKFLVEYGEEIVGLVLHPVHKRTYGDEILASVSLDSSKVFNGAKINERDTVEAIRDLAPEIGVSALFGYILRPETLCLFPAGCVNVHPSLLPFNRGAYPNVWSIVEGTPAGATVHYLDVGIDTGHIIAQREVPVEPVDTGLTLYRKLEVACVDVFKEAWPLIRLGQAPRVPQSLDAGTYHRVHDVEKIDEIDLEKRYLARDLINVLRARTFPPYPGAYFLHQGRKVYLRLQLIYDEELEGAADETRH